MKYTTSEWIHFCTEQHDKTCNQKYDHSLPYSFHLNMVAAQAKQFSDLLSGEDYAKVVWGCYGHDLIEDARLSYNDIKFHTGEEIAEIIFLCTEMRGRDRGERKNNQFYNDLMTNKLAVFVKLCDIMANSLYSTLSGSSMIKKQREEWPSIRVKILPTYPEYGKMINYLDSIYEL